MQEFDALKIAKVSTISSYEKSERKIKLNDEYSWFLSEEFKQLYKPITKSTSHDISRQIVCCKMNSNYSQVITKNILNNLRTCDTENNSCHTLKINYNHKEDEKNNTISNGNNISEYIDTNRTFETNDNTISSNKDSKINVNNNNNLSYVDKSNEYLNKAKLKENNNSSFSHDYIKEKNSSLMDKKYFTLVTLSHENCHKENKELKPKQKKNILKEVVEDILKIIMDENGQIALNYALQSACQKSSTVKEYLKDEKLTARDSRKVRNIFVEINRHPNIKVVKKKPQLIVKWIESEKENEVLVNN